MLPSKAPSASIFEATTILPSAALTTPGKERQARAEQHSEQPRRQPAHVAFCLLAGIILPRRSVHVEPRFREPPP